MNAHRWHAGAVSLVVIGFVALTVAAGAQPPSSRQRVRPVVPRPPSDESHGPPAGWTFTLPRGDAARGREVFAKLECYKCHEVHGESFPPPAESASVGPELASMVGHHPPEFFAESIMNPNAVIDEPRFRAPDGSSRMPSFNDSITVQELIDLVAFLLSLTPPAGDTDHGRPAGGGHKH
jgi:mono/diheme cytochrome c family protein